jgi:hypothetical protein
MKIPHRQSGHFGRCCPDCQQSGNLSIVSRSFRSGMNLAIPSDVP